jgi:predicted alpha-1,2-mannosidase
MPARRLMRAAALGLLLGATTAADAAQLARLVDVFTGTEAGGGDFQTGGGAGNTFPGAVVPFGMLAWSPDTVPGKVNHPGGYSWGDQQLRGFSLTHVNGAGCGTHLDFPILPTSAPVTKSPAVAGSYDVDPAFVPSFTHDRERAEPGFYGVDLDPGTPREIGVGLAATTRAGLGRFEFPRTQTASVLVNAGGSSMANGLATFTVDPGRREISGAVESGQFCYHLNRYTIYFAAEFDRPFDAWGTWRKQALAPGGTDTADQAAMPFHLRPISAAPFATSASNGAQAGAWVTFDARADRIVRMRVAVSYVSVENARDNLRREQPDWDFGRARRHARGEWNRALGTVRVRGGSAADQRTFYTMLYHALLGPTVFSDANGEYMGMDGVVRSAGGRVQYTTFSGWDVYRSQIPLLALLLPDRASDMMQSLVRNAQESGWLPRWSVAAAHTNVMVGDPAAAMIAGAHAFGARDFDRPAALAAMLKGATDPVASDGHVQRQGLAGYLVRGWVPHDGTETSSGASSSMFGTPDGVWGSAATTLEYTTADFAIARFAAALGDAATCRAFLARAGGWSSLFNPATGYLQPRYADGAFPATFDPAAREGFVEGNAAQYLWMVPHDVGRLTALLGGTAATTARLDDFFRFLNAGDEEPFAYLANEPCALTPWLYAWLGQPAKTQATVRRALLDLFDDSPAGYAGNDDLGQMSAWYVFGALGLYPAIPGTDVLALGSPLFRRATLERGDGRRLTIVGRGARRDRPYVRSLTVDGRPHDRPWCSRAASPAWT